MSRALRTLLIATVLTALPAVSFAGVFFSVTVAPPALPVYVQPICPGDGYIWTPGYWAYDDFDGWYWVPGTWVLAPRAGLLWTPGYWAFAGGFYTWHVGYWGPHVGFYGGVNYGFGYTGVGFVGGFWSGGVFRYNTAVSNVNITNVHNTYNQTVVNNTTVVNNNRSSFNGPGGTTATPTATEQAAMRESHVSPTSAQVAHEKTANANRSQLAARNMGTTSNFAANNSHPNMNVSHSNTNTPRTNLAPAANAPHHAESGFRSAPQPHNSFRSASHLHRM